MARFVGKLDFAPQDPNYPDEWRLGQDFGFLRDDGVMVIAQMHGHTDGASVPRFLWRVVGHPFRRGNRFWALPHDAGYNGYAVIIDLNAAEVTPEYALDNWRNSDIVGFINSADLSRKWWDRTLQQAMVAMNEKRWKRRAVYSAVRLFGWRSYSKHRGKREVHG